MLSRIHLVGAWNGGAGRTFTAALLAHGLHLQGRRTVLVRQIHNGSLVVIDPFAVTLPLPCRDLCLPAPFVLPHDLEAGMATMVHDTDGRFVDALHDLALAEVGEDADVVVDLSCHARALNAATLRVATVVLVPARATLFESDWAVRTFTGIRHTHRYRHLLVPTLVASIAPDTGRAQHMSQLCGLLRDCDPEHELLPGEPSEFMVAAPFLDDSQLRALFDERPLWRDPDLQAACIGFAIEVAERAEAVLATILEQVDEF